MRAFKTLRDFLELLETDKQLLRITDAVSLEPDLAAAGRAVNQAGGETSPALLFNNIKGFAKAEVVMNAHGSWPNLALMLGMEKDASLTQQFFEFVRRYRLFPGKMDHRTNAPWQEVVIENDINLFLLLPLFRLNQGDGGFYIDRACIVSRDPDDWNNEDIQNVGMYRLQVKGTTSPNTRWLRSCRAAIIRWSRVQRASTSPGAHNTFSKAASWRASAKSRAHSANFPASIPAAATIR